MSLNYYVLKFRNISKTFKAFTLTPSILLYLASRMIVILSCDQEIQLNSTRRIQLAQAWIQ